MNAQKAIYLVTSGTYSDYGIRAAFSTHDKAEAFCLVWDKSGWEKAEIEEWALDSPPEVWSLVTVNMDRDGKCLYARQEVSDTMSYDEPITSFIKWNAETLCLCHTVVTADQQQAVKATNELRAQIIAANVWGDNEKLRQMLGIKEHGPLP